MKTTKVIAVITFILTSLCSLAQEGVVEGRVMSGTQVVPSASVRLKDVSVITDSTGYFKFMGVTEGEHTLWISSVGYNNQKKSIFISKETGVADSLIIELKLREDHMDEVVVTGTLKEVKRIESPVPVEVYNHTFFKKNPTPNIFDALQNVNGVRPQLNCNVCNTGDIHINGLEGPYTMVLIDGMPIVSSLSTVYGLSGIPNSLVERIEIVKGPASSLYGSEAVGGLINIITKNPSTASKFSADLFMTSWKELNADIAFKFNLGKKVTSLTGLNYFKYDNIKDENNDNFTDVTLQHRISLFQKWKVERKDNRVLDFATRFFYEDRWGGEVKWNKQFRGGDSIYGESIYTRRVEVIGNYQLPVKPKMLLSFSFNDHDQDSRYGTTAYIARQKIAFSQLTFDKSFRNHDVLIGAALRYTKYDDNTIATELQHPKFLNKPDKTWLPGFFVQDEFKFSDAHTLLLGFRYDHNSIHGNIFTPRVAYKWKIDPFNILRINAGTGYRVVNLFTEDHAALTGARVVEVQHKLSPEKTINVNINLLKKIYTGNGTFIGLDVTSWYTYFNNRIIGDLDTDPDKIIYANLDGYAVSKGISTNLDVVFNNGLKIIAGFTLQDVSTIENDKRKQQLLTEKFSGTWAITYKIKPLKLSIDYTGNVYGPMRLPLLGDLDPRRPVSPTWSVQNIQFSYAGIKGIEVYSGVKNLLNWTPAKNNPFIIARSNDPFDKNVVYDNDGKIKATSDNPYALSFDPNYLYAPNQGIRVFAGIRMQIK